MLPCSPKYRGAAPIQWAIANGETQTGLTTMRIDAGMDTGDILLQEPMNIAPDGTTASLATRLAEAGAPLMAETLRGVEAGTLPAKHQDHAQATYAPLLKKEDGKNRLDTFGGRNLQPHARLYSLAGSLHHFSRQQLSHCGGAGV